MANEQLFTNAKFQANAVDVSAYVTDISLNYGSESLDATTMAGTARKHKGGVTDWSFDITFLYDKSTSGPEANLFALVGTTACYEYRPINVCSSANNPTFSGVGTLTTLNHGGAYGNLLSLTAKVEAYGAITRASSS